MIVPKAVVQTAYMVAFAAATTNVQVDTGTTYQNIDGFGFSQAFGRAKEFQNTESGLQKQALDLLFSTSTGAGFSIIRNRIGSGASDSIEPNDPGSPSATPDYTWDGDDSGQVWFSKQAQSYGVNIIYADAWSAPGYMKTSGDEAAPGYLCGAADHTCDSGDWTQAYADYLVQYVKYYAQEGITVTHLGFLNEPDFEVSYSQMQINDDASDAIDFIPILDDAINAAGLDLNMTCCDAVGWTKQQDYTESLRAAGSTGILDVITSHVYSADATSPMDTNLPAWVTEGAPGTEFTGTWYSSGADNEGLTWASKIATGFLDANLSAYLFWEGFENGETQSASHLVDVDGGDAYASGIYYAFAMWSRFIRPGATRIGADGSLSDVATAAFQNADGSTIVVFTNTGDAAQTASVSVAGGSVSEAQAWLTDNSNKVASTDADLSGDSVAVSIPGHSVVTVKLS